MINNQKGFTIPELLVALILTSLFIGLIITFTFNYWRFSGSLEAESDSLVQRLNVSDYMRDLIGGSSGLITQNSIEDNNVLKADPMQANGKFWEEVHALNTNIPNNNGVKPLMYLRKDSINTSGAVIMNGTYAYEDEFVLYLNANDKSLYVRSLANPFAPSNKLLTTCPPSIATSTCPRDLKLIENVDSVDVRYFSRSGVIVDWTSIYDINTSSYAGPDFPAVEVAELKINVLSKPTILATNTVKNSTIIRVALRNS